MSNPFTPLTVNQLVIKNRFARSSTHEGLADNETGEIGSRIKEVLVELAQNEIGLIFTGHAYVSIEGKAGPNQFAADSDIALESAKDVLEQIRSLGSKTILQLAHAGGYAPFGVAVSPSSFTVNDRTSQELTIPQIKEIVNKFAQAALRAYKVGFDGVQIHAAHGYLLSQFLSSHYNKRIDEYGGSAENRARIVREILTAIRQVVPRDFPVLIKINSDNFLPDGYAESVPKTLLSLQELGLDGVELSGGVPDTPVKLGSARPINLNESDPAYYETQAKAIKSVLDIPIILTGGVRYLSKVEELIANGVCDMVSLSRPLIREPNLVKRWHDGDLSRPKCINCNGCFKPVITARGFYCPPEERAKK